MDDDVIRVLVAIEDVLDEMSRILREQPFAMDFEIDACETWPNRWMRLLTFLKAKRDAVAGRKDCHE